MLFRSNAIASFSSGTLLVRSGWDAVNYVVVPALIVAALVLVFGERQAKAASA